MVLDGIKFSRTNKANAVFTTAQPVGWYVPGSNVVGAVGIQSTKSALFCMTPYIDESGKKWYAVYTHDNHGPIRWVPEEDIKEIELLSGGVIKALYSTIHKALRGFHRLEVA